MDIYSVNNTLNNLSSIIYYSTYSLFYSISPLSIIIELSSHLDSYSTHSTIILINIISAKITSSVHNFELHYLIDSLILIHLSYSIHYYYPILISIMNIMVIISITFSHYLM